MSEDPFKHFSPEEMDLFIRFLVLIRDNYTKADKAAHFLERKAGIAHTCSMANLRDALSHMATLLDPMNPSEKRADQLSSAGEHLRRAIIEPYEIALGALTVKFGPIYDSYREKVLPIRESTEGFGMAPTRPMIEARLQEIDDLAGRGKHAKARNKWDEEWESGVSSLIDAYSKLADLHGELEDLVFRYNQHAATQLLTNSSRHHTGLHKWGIFWTILGTVLGIIIGSGVTYLITKHVSGPEKVPSVSAPKPSAAEK